MKLRPNRKQVIRGVLLLCALAYISYGVVEPQTSPGHAVFHAGYSVPFMRPAFLRFYRWSLRRFNAGYLPGSIDEFLVTRLWDSSSTERQAVIDFQIRQSSARWGESLSHVHDDLKRQVISDIVARLDSFSPGDAADALLLIEAMRRNDALHKGGFSNLYLWSNDGRTVTLRTDRVAAAKQSFRRWWANGTAWPQNKTQDPLEGTDLAIHYGP